MDRVTTVTAPWCGTEPESVAFCCQNQETWGCGKNGWASRPLRTSAGRFFSNPDVQSSAGRVFRNSSAQLLLFCAFVLHFTNTGDFIWERQPG